MHTFSNEADRMDLLTTEILDIAIEDARTNKKVIDSKMDSVMTLMREVEMREKVAEKAKQELDNFSLHVNAELDELILAHQQAKETNDKRAREVYARKADLATEMNELHFRVSGVLNEGDGCLVDIDQMCKSLEKRLNAAITKKEAADQEKLEKEVTLAYRKHQMEELVEESMKLEQEEMENLKLQEFLMDRGHIVNMLQEELSCKCQDVGMLKVELENSQDENEKLVTKDYLRPIIQDTIPSQVNCECFNCNFFKGAKVRVVGSKKEIIRTNKMCKSSIINSKNKEQKEWIKRQIIDAVADHEEGYMF